MPSGGSARKASGLRADRAQADARGVPADIMMPRILLMTATFLLVLLGLVMVFSASSVEAISQEKSIFSYVAKQAVFVAAGVALAAAVVRFVPYQAWRGRLFFLLWGVAIALLVAVVFVGTDIYGAQRWIYIGFFSLQPSEFAKIILVIAGARVLCEFNEGLKDAKQAALATFVLVILPTAFLYQTQSDMGSAIIILMGIFAVMWIGEVPKAMFFGLLVIVVIAGAVGIVGYRADRVAVWLDPWNDGESGYGTGFQMIRAYYAFAEGGIFGVGLGNSREKFLYLPEAETDFIFAIIGEELGMVGAACVIVLFLVVLLAGLRIAAKAPDDFGRVLAGGLTAMLVGQAFLNMACATGLFPTTGKPLPFISSGGSSAIASLLIVGVILSVSYGSNTLTPYERRRNDLNVISVKRPAGARRDGAGAREAEGDALSRTARSARFGRIGRDGAPDARRAARPRDEVAASRDRRPSRSRDDASRDRRPSRGGGDAGGISLGTGRDRSYFDGRRKR